MNRRYNGYAILAIPNENRTPKGKFFTWLKQAHPDFEIFLWHGCFIADVFEGLVTPGGMHTRMNLSANVDFSKTQIWKYLQEYRKINNG